MSGHLPNMPKLDLLETCLLFHGQSKKKIKYGDQKEELLSKIYVPNSVTKTKTTKKWMVRNHYFIRSME